MSVLSNSRLTSRSRLLLVSLIAVIFAVGFLAGNTGRAQTVAPGSDADPLVSQSYVDQFVGLVVIELHAGQMLEGMGGTEIIVRSGQVTATSSPLGGLSNVTAGKDMVQGERVPLNHLLIVPRSDGRGIVAQTRAFVMVRGLHIVR